MVGYVLLGLSLVFQELVTLLQIIRWAFDRTPVDIKKQYGNWAVVTGASDGIGKSYCKQLAAKGINIVLIGRNKEKLKGVVDEIEKETKVETKIIIADFTQGREIYKNIREELETVDVGILVNNVGIQYHHPMSIAELPEDEIWDNVHVNITSAVMMTRIILPKLKEKNKGAIINVSSGSCYQHQPYMNLYAASKSYVTSFSDGLQLELGKTNITVQTLTPYYVSSKINHFQKRLLKVSLFIPDTDTFVASALGSLGKVSSTTGYWPHRLQYLFLMICPRWLRGYVIGKMYRAMQIDFVKNELKKS